MARGRGFSVLCMPDECAHILLEIHEEKPLYGLEIHYGNECFIDRDLNVESLCAELIGSSEGGGHKHSLLLIRFRQQVLDPEKSVMYYKDNTIAEGLVQLVVPRMNNEGILRLTRSTVGTDPPNPGIESPIPLFNKLKRMFRKACPHVHEESVGNYKIWMSDGFLKYRENSGQYWLA